MNGTGRIGVARSISVKYLLRASVALSILVTVTACQSAVMKDKPDPEPPEPAFSFVGTWRYETPRREMLVDGEDYVTVGAEVRTLTFTKSRWILHTITIPNDFAPPDLDLHDDASSGEWGSVMDSTITKTLLDWNDEEDRAHDEPTHVIRKYHVASGGLVLMQPWHDDQPDDPYVRVERVDDPEADLVGRWMQDFENEDEAWNVDMSLGADGSFRRVFTRARGPQELRRLEVTGTYELDMVEKFIHVTIAMTFGNGEPWSAEEFPFWGPGESLRFAYAPSNNPNLIVMSMPWWEQMYDRDLEMKVDRPENRYGAYWDRLTKVE